ncbi:hypothetical protein LSH36_101g05001 [Paralvinella palmiformis]|uniref:Apyrase n=1 Tax=Paralvinella palmiformis TaxID=53620 RepID=A0AAD9NBA2_9ANNE|nr:hypothetical protein LSH36_101g05001 [Paralvinella palmiformis]
MMQFSFWSRRSLVFWIVTCAWAVAKAQTEQQSYAIIVDAGSSGSRVRLFRWTSQRSGSHLPQFEEFFSEKKEPGISTFRNDKLSGIKPYLAELIEAAKRQIPEDKHQLSPIYLLATAGMRLLMEPKANTIMDQIRKLLSHNDYCPFYFNQLQARILSGEEEGVFAWIAANYLNRYFDNPVVGKSAGILELGGASTQIAFIPDGSILADKFPVRLAGRVYPLYVHSYLYYGQNFADLWVKEYLHRKNRELTELTNPCMLRGDRSVVTISNLKLTFHGSGDPVKCKTLVDQLVFKVEPYHCYPKPCAIGQVYQPTISKTKTFFALSAFTYPLKTLGVLDDTGVFTPAEAYEAAINYCQKDIQTIINETGREPDFLSVECLMEWPLGAIIYETERQSLIWCARSEMVTSASYKVLTPTGSFVISISIILIIL